LCSVCVCVCTNCDCHAVRICVSLGSGGDGSALSSAGLRGAQAPLHHAREVLPEVCARVSVPPSVNVGVSSSTAYTARGSCGLHDRARSMRVRLRVLVRRAGKAGFRCCAVSRIHQCPDKGLRRQFLPKDTTLDFFLLPREVSRESLVSSIAPLIPPSYTTYFAAVSPQPVHDQGAPAAPLQGPALEIRDRRGPLR